MNNGPDSGKVAKMPIETFCTEIVVKRSRFVACGKRFDDPELLKEEVAAVREAHRGCSHVVWAYVCGPSGELIGLSDDHEPKGTAGRPVFEVVKGSGITNILVTVTRYFGGTKLGTGGLVKAYSEAAKAVVEAIAVEDFVERIGFRMGLAYEVYDACRRAAAELDAEVTEEVFTDRVRIVGMLPARNAESFVRRIRDITSGRTLPELLARSPAPP